MWSRWMLFYKTIFTIRDCPACLSDFTDATELILNIPSFVIAGPDTWHEKFPIANGPRQSPIDIVTGEARYDPELRPLTLRYDPSVSLDIINNGHSVQVTFSDDKDASS